MNDLSVNFKREQTERRRKEGDSVRRASVSVALNMKQVIEITIELLDLSFSFLIIRIALYWIRCSILNLGIREI